MSNLELAPSVMRFYGETVNEDSRLRSSADGRMELVRTQELLRRFLPPAAGVCWTSAEGPGFTLNGW